MGAMELNQMRFEVFEANYASRPFSAIVGIQSNNSCALEISGR